MPDFDPAWDMPLPNWQQQGSFVAPVIPPASDPDAGTLYPLPCINIDWLLLLMGAADQLRNPSTWDAATPAIRDTALSRANKLFEMLWSASHGVCVNPVVQVAIDCTNGLQYQLADGTWHVGTSMADICACTTACIVAPIPPNPQGATTDQQACNLAGFLASEIIQKTMVAMESYVGTTNQEVDFAHALLQSLAFAFPITSGFGNAAYQFYQDVVGQLLAQVTAAATDPSLWSLVTCAIYNAIRSVGHVDATNYATAGANIHAIGYAYPWAPNAVGNFWNELGLVNIQALQNVGALDDVDCTDCGAWCHLMDFVPNNDGWNLPGSYGTYTTGVGFTGASYAPRGSWVVSDDININPTHPFLTQIDVGVGFHGSYPSGGVRQIYLQLGGSTVRTLNLPNGATSGVQKFSFSFAATQVDQITVWFEDSAPGGGTVFQYCQIHGTGTCPFGGGCIACTH